MIRNGAFTEGWTDIGHAKQQPAGWRLSWLEAGQALYDSGDVATGAPECAHKLASQLPPNEQQGASNALILAGDATYKIFAHGAAFGAELRQRIAGLQPGTVARLTVPILAVLYGETDVHAAESGAWLIGEAKVGQWANAGVMGNRRWYRHVAETAVPYNGTLDVVIRVKSKYPNRKDFFIDGVTLEAVGQVGPTPPPETGPADTEVLKAVLRLIGQVRRQIDEIEDLVEHHIRG